MKTYNRIAILWAVCILIIGADRLVFPKKDGAFLADLLLWSSSSLIGIVSLYLWKKEIGKGTKWVFFNFAVWFLGNAIVSPIFDFYRHSMHLSDNWLMIMYIQYYLLGYFLFLFVSVLFLVFDQVMASHGLGWKYLFVFVMAGAVWGICAYPFFADPKVLLKEPSYRDYLIIRKSVANLQNMGVESPTPAEVAVNLSSRSDKNAAPLTNLPSNEWHQRIAEILPYIPGSNGVNLYFSPLWTKCAFIGLVSVILLICLAVRQYLVDSSIGAYMEKIVWCLLLYCIFEALHFYVFTKVSDVQVWLKMSFAGEYLSLGVMWILCGLFALRLRFIGSVEGNYYERHLVEAPDGITRWRDSFDNWVLRQFMQSKDLEGRFALRRKTSVERPDVADS